MKKVVKLTESDLKRIVQKVIKESDLEGDELETFIEADEYASNLMYEMESELENLIGDFLRNIELENLIKGYQYKFKEKYPMYVNSGYENDNIDSFMELSVKDGLDEISVIMVSSLIDEIYPRF